MTPDITVIVVNWNGARWLPACLDSLLLQRDASFEIVVVDNGSSDESAALVQERYPQVRWLSLGTNRGFAAANNAGARLGRGRYLAFLNNDAEAEPGWLAALARSLDTNADAALVTSCIVRRDRPGIIDSAGDGWLRVGTAFKRGHGGPAGAWSEADEVFGACGAACMIRRDVFERIGGFDEDFFLVFEDVDLSYRVRLAGHRCLYVPSARVRHAVSASLGHVSVTSVFYGQRNVEWVYLKNTPTSLLIRSLPGHLLYLAAASVYFLVRGRFGAFLRAKAAVATSLGSVWRKRRQIQATRVATAADLLPAMTRGWLRVKWRDKGLAEAAS